MERFPSLHMRQRLASDLNVSARQVNKSRSFPRPFCVIMDADDCNRPHRRFLILLIPAPNSCATRVRATTHCDLPRLTAPRICRFRFGSRTVGSATATARRARRARATRIRSPMMYCVRLATTTFPPSHAPSPCAQESLGPNSTCRPGASLTRTAPRAMPAPYQHLARREESIRLRCGLGLARRPLLPAPRATGAHPTLPSEGRQV